jgi:hypothetical protein
MRYFSKLFTFFTFMDFKNFIKVRLKIIFTIEIQKVKIILNFNIGRWWRTYFLNWIHFAPVKRLCYLVKLVYSARVHLAYAHRLFSWLFQDNLVSVIVKSFNQISSAFNVIVGIWINWFFIFNLLFNLL